MEEETQSVEKTEKEMQSVEKADNVELKEEKHKKEKKNKKDKTSKFDIRDFFASNKKIFIVGGIVLVVVIVAIVGAALLFGKKEDSQKELLTKKAEELAEHFYVDTYYPNLLNPETHELMTDEERKEYAAKFSVTGIILNLNNLARSGDGDSQEILKEFVNEKGKACNYETSKVTVIPVAPYGAKDYRVEVSFDCDFEDDK